jgi:hypothetical protein
MVRLTRVTVGYLQRTIGGGDQMNDDGVVEKIERWNITPTMHGKPRYRVGLR